MNRAQFLRALLVAPLAAKAVVRAMPAASPVDAVKHSIAIQNELFKLLDEAQINPWVKGVAFSCTDIELALKANNWDTVMEKHMASRPRSSAAERFMRQARRDLANAIDVPVERLYGEVR